MQNRPHLLLVDDDPRLTSILELVFQSQGYDLTVAYDGLQGRDAAYANAIDAIILDAMLPGLDGRDLCRQLKSDPATAHIPIIIFSCLADLDKEINLPADAFVTKPSPVSELLQKLEIVMQVRN